MSRVITFSTRFPSYHPKAGQPTEFVEKIWESLYPDIVGWSGFGELSQQFNVGLNNIYDPKHHTIRAGNRWKAGDKFSPRIWSGKPYQSKQIIIGPDIEVKRTWKIELVPHLWWDECVVKIEGVRLTSYDFERLAKFDGLSPRDMLLWLAGPNMASSIRKPFDGQIVCWNDKVSYELRPWPHFH